MITATILKRDQQIYGFVISGHSGYDEAGKDIVCSAVSILAENTVNAIEAFTGDTVEKLDVDARNGIIDFRLRDVSDESQTLLNTLVLGLNDISGSYASFVTVQVEAD
jgi:uncharacterized protein YsxB (DUF464 family)